MGDIDPSSVSHFKTTTSEPSDIEVSLGSFLNCARERPTFIYKKFNVRQIYVVTYIRSQIPIYRYSGFHRHSLYLYYIKKPLPRGA